MQMVLILERGPELKRAGMQLALDNAGEWRELVVAEARTWLAGRTGRVTIEQFRQVAQCKPDSHKAWGSLPGMLCRAGLIKPALHADGSPVYAPADSAKTHAHPVRVWEVA